ncbi:MAG TPA: hypothetical protein VGR64_09000, partial [Terracidiphilus sp.]|nr:hypothetical protein [Terracidiphilus sp.]
MNLSTQNDDRNAATIDAERSLRLIASLPAPAGIEERVKAGLRDGRSQSGVIGWPVSSPTRLGWAQVSYMRAAAAAAIVFVVAGGGWGVYRHFGPAPAPTAAGVQQRIEGGSGLSAAGAMRTPKTVEGPKVAGPETVKDGRDAGSAYAKQRVRGDLRRQEKKNRPSLPEAAVR